MSALPLNRKSGAHVKARRREKLSSRGDAGTRRENQKTSRTNNHPETLRWRPSRKSRCAANGNRPTKRWRDASLGVLSARHRFANAECGRLSQCQLSAGMRSPERRWRSLSFFPNNVPRIHTSNAGRDATPWDPIISSTQRKAVLTQRRGDAEGRSGRI